MEKYLLITAKEHNWQLTGPGDWVLQSWRIYSDRTYRLTVVFNPGIEDNDYKKRTRWQKGIISEKCFNTLLGIVKNNNWGNPERGIDMCDGTAWEIKSYSPDGKILESSGDVGYIDGDSILESIVACLPDPDFSI